MSEDIQDWELVARVRDGDSLAFDTLMARYMGPVLNFVARMLGDHAEAEDVAQETFVRAYRGLQAPHFRAGPSRFSTWLFQIARHAALDCLRRRRRRPWWAVARGEAPAPELATSHTAPDDLRDRETGVAIAAALAELPEPQRAAIVLSECEGLSQADIATALECSEKSVEARLYRARRFLRERLAHLLT